MPTPSGSSFENVPANYGEAEFVAILIAKLALPLVVRGAAQKKQRHSIALCGRFLRAHRTPSMS